MKNIAYYNGRTAPIEEMMVPMNDRACYFGDGVYDATIALNHVPLAFQDHIDRIYRSAGLAEIPLRMPKEEMKAILQGLVDQVEGDELILYWQVTRGVGMPLMRSPRTETRTPRFTSWNFISPWTRHAPPDGVSMKK